MTPEQKVLIESNPAHVEWLRDARVRYADEIARFGLERIMRDLFERGILSGAERDWILADAAVATKED